MKFYQAHVVQKARKDRTKGLSIRKIARKYNISDSSISRWVRDIEGHHFAFKRAQERVALWKKESKHIGESFPVDRTSAKMLLSLLYWCEGSKYPMESCVSFTNSDWKLIKTFLELLRSATQLKEDKLRARLQIHTTHSYKKLLRFWSEWLHIPPSQFHKPTVTKPTKNMKRLDYRGTCTIKYYDVTLLLEIMGIFESFAERFGEVPKRL